MTDIVDANVRVLEILKQALALVAKTPKEDHENLKIFVEICERTFYLFLVRMQEVFERGFDQGILGTDDVENAFTIIKRKHESGEFLSDEEFDFIYYVNDFLSEALENKNIASKLENPKIIEISDVVLASRGWKEFCDSSFSNNKRKSLIIDLLNDEVGYILQFISMLRIQLIYRCGLSINKANKIIEKAENARSEKVPKLKYLKRRSDNFERF